MEDPRPALSSATATGDASAMDHCCASPNGASPSQPRAPPNTAAAGAPSSSGLASKRQRRSVAEAAQVAQVRQKVALFESFKGAAASSSSSSSSATAAGGASPSSPGPARPFAGAPGSGGKGSMGSASSGSASVGSSSYHAVFPGLDLSLTSLPSRAALLAAQPHASAATAPRASEEKVDRVVAPVEASRDDAVGAPPTQQITAAMRELRIAEMEKGQPKAMEEEGPEPIIECNHKQPVLAFVGGRGASGGGAGHHEGAQHHQQPPPPPPSKPSGEHETGGFFGMVQKTLGLGKHRASSTGGAQQQVQPAPAAALSPPLSPLRPENTYQMSDRYVFVFKTYRS